MTGPEHYRAAERTLADVRGLLDQSDVWMDADSGWMADLSTDERIQRRTADIAAAQVLATLASTHAELAHAAIAAAHTLPVSAAREGWPAALGYPEEVRS